MTQSAKYDFIWSSVSGIHMKKSTCNSMIELSWAKIIFWDWKNENKHDVSKNKYI